MWRALFRGEKFAIEYEPAFEPFPQYLLVRWDIVEKPLVADVVEAAFDVSFEYPFGGTRPRKQDEALLYGIMSASVLAETI